jgi:hypothetical protein
MRKFGPETVFATYRVRAGKEPAFLALVERHWPTLQRLGFTNGEPALVFQGTDASGGPLVYEVFTWKDKASVDHAHEHPEVAAIWEAMEPLVESRKGREKWEFPHVRPVAMPYAASPA